MWHKDTAQRRRTGDNMEIQRGDVTQRDNVGTRQRGPPPGWPWGDTEDPGGAPSPPRPRCSGETVRAPLPPRPPRLRLDVSASPEFPPAPGPRTVPAGGRVFVQCRAEPCPRRRGGASGAGSAPQPRPRPHPGPARGRSLRTVTRPIVVTLGPVGTAAPGPPPVPFPPPPPLLRLPPPPQRDRPRPPPTEPAVPPGAVAAVSFGAFVVGAALAGGLWFVHGRTAAPRPPPAPPSSSAAPQPGGGQLRTTDPKPPPARTPLAAT
ncbi:basic proline-rich protein-like [Accipiter gentilis]|uniref:basic proline-rich protein-like n=1 Tax=Astur gentilis TaxID=8957 RepID=UPI00210F6C85|nr:basic proline-rich protein-like [Accipiter gentilis]